MSTRATYWFPGQEHSPSVCFYIHYDGYPEGASSYFRAMLNEKNERGGLAAQFMRANKYAEFTTSHNSHGDTEYRYDVRHDGSLTAQQRSGHSDKWDTFFVGQVGEFCNAHAPFGDTDAPKFVRLQITSYGRAVWMELPAALKALDIKRLHCLLYVQRHGYCGNAESMFNDFAAGVKSLGDDAPERLRDQAHTALDMLSELKILRQGYYVSSAEELSALVAERGLNIKPSRVFGVEKSDLSTALSAADACGQCNLDVKAYRHKRSQIIYGVPAGYSPAEFVNANCIDIGSDEDFELVEI